MHEASLMNSLMAQIETVVDAQKAERAVSLCVQLGALSHLSPEHFREHFERAAAGTRADGARLNISVIEDVNHPMAQEIVLASVEVETEDEG